MPTGFRPPGRVCDSGMDREVRRFLEEVVDSYETLQVLPLLFRRTGDRRSTAAIAAELEIPVRTVEAVVLQLEGRGLVRRTGRAECCYEPGTAEDATLTALAHLYATDAAEVLRVLSTHAIERVRGSAARLFAEAFR